MTLSTFFSMIAAALPAAPSCLAAVPAAREARARASVAAMVDLEERTWRWRALSLEVAAEMAARRDASAASCLWKVLEAMAMR